MTEIKVGNINTDKASSEPEPKADIGIRPYFAETDRKYVQHLFYYNYFNFVPRSAFMRMKDPYLLSIWLGVYAYLIVYIPKVLGTLELSYNLMLGIRFLITLVVSGLGILAFFWIADKDITRRVMEGCENDLKEPDTYYRGTPEDTRQGNFWVLTLNGQIIGCAGMDHNEETVLDKSSVHIPYVRASDRLRAADDPNVHGAEWKKFALFLAKADDIIRLILVGGLDILRDAYLWIKGVSNDQLNAQNAKKKEVVLFDAHKPNEASVRRLAIKPECHGHGLSTVLLKRVALWAHSHQFEYLYADVNELETKMADILVKKHGYTFVSKKKVGYFRSKSTYKLDVKLWMSKELERQAEKKRLEEQEKEDQELKEFE